VDSVSVLRGARRRVARALGMGAASGSTTGRSGTAFRVRPVPRAIPTPWPEPPVVERPAEIVDAIPEPPLRRYDLALFEALQAEYASKPIAPGGPRYDQASIAERSRRRVDSIHQRIGLADQTVLEVGCASGYEVWYLGNHLGCDAWGIDIQARKAWPALAGPRVHLVAGDMADEVLPASTFDRAISFTVWEHVERPYEALAELYRVMRPGGLAWIRANLHRGPTASHLARYIHFPYPHLLFTDEVIDEGLRRAGIGTTRVAWVNRLTWEQYEVHLLDLGFRIRALTFDRYPLDEDFYTRFADVLGRYPRRDLERGFFTVILEKPKLGRLSWSPAVLRAPRSRRPNER
jgi:SAM-dependent methyltransferase